MKTEELPIEEVPTEKEFYIGVRYYSSNTPFASIYEDMPDDCDHVYKVKIPFKKPSNEHT